MQAVPVLHNNNRAKAVTRRRVLLDHRITGQRVSRLVGILRIIGFDRLIDPAQIDGPIITGV